METTFRWHRTEKKACARQYNWHINMIWFHEPLSKRPTDQPFAPRSWPTNSDIYNIVQYLLNLLWVNDLTLNIPKMKSGRKNKSVFIIIQSNYKIMVTDTHNWNTRKRNLKTSYAIISTNSSTVKGYASSMVNRKKKTFSLLLYLSLGYLC